MHTQSIDEAANGGAPGPREFIALMAFAMSLVALSIDAMLPAFPEMTRDLQLATVNDVQPVISMLFIGLALGQLFYGPLSDTTGRKPAMYIGFALFIVGSLLSMLAANFTLMLLGRFLQGVGAAGPRTVALALIRDRYHGSSMARVMSFIMTVFILVPIFAPALGQGILFLAGWRAIYGVFVLLAGITLVWLAIRQPETLARENRRPFTLRDIRAGFRDVLSNRVAMAYTLVTGFVSGAFFGYLNICQQIFQVQYGLGAKFPLYFALLAFAVGLASLLNSGMVMRFGMQRPGELGAARDDVAVLVVSGRGLVRAWPARTVAVHGDLPGAVFFRRNPVRQSQFNGHGAAGSRSRNRRSGDRLHFNGGGGGDGVLDWSGL